MRFLRAKTEQVCRSSATTQPHSETLTSTHASPLPIHTRAFYFQLWLLGRLIPLFTAICPLFPFLAGRERISNTTSPSSGSRWGGRPVSTTDSFSSNHNAYLHHYQVAHHSPLTTHHSTGAGQVAALGVRAWQAAGHFQASSSRSLLPLQFPLPCIVSPSFWKTSSFCVPSRVGQMLHHYEHVNVL